MANSTKCVVIGTRLTQYNNSCLFVCFKPIYLLFHLAILTLQSYVVRKFVQLVVRVNFTSFLVQREPRYPCVTLSSHTDINFLFPDYFAKFWGPFEEIFANLDDFGSSISAAMNVTAQARFLLTRACTHTRTHAHTHTRTHAHVHAHTHTHSHTHHSSLSLHTAIQWEIIHGTVCNTISH